MRLERKETKDTDGWHDEGIEECNMKWTEGRMRVTSALTVDIISLFTGRCQNREGGRETQQGNEVVKEGKT